MKNAIRSVAALLTACAISQSAIADDYYLSSRTDGNPDYQYFPSPNDWRDVNMYQIFTDRFNDGNPGNNNVRGWYTTEGYRHYAMGGDWKGAQDKLGYLQGMGVNCVWISGVQINAQGTDTAYAPYHAYHPTDFYRVEPMFGTFQELKDLIDDAHSRGMYIIIDVVINHMADLNGLGDGKDKYYHPNGGGNLRWWNDSKKHAAPFDNLAYFHNNGKIENYEDYWQQQNGQFVGTDDLKTEDPFVASHLTEAFKNLIDATDCDGFRVDAIKHVNKDDFLMPWADAMRQHAAWRGKNNFILFGENFNYDDYSVAEHCKDYGYAFNSALYFPMQQTIQDVFNNEWGTDRITQRRNNLHLYGEGQNNLVTFIDNHDVNRFSLYNGNVWQEKLKPALTFLYTGTPVPCLFYGTEHGFNQGGQPNMGSEDGDYQRECMMDYGYQPGNAWGDKFNSGGVYNHIAALNGFRRDYPCLTRGDMTVRWEEGGKGLYAYTRTLEDQEGLVVFNTEWSTKSGQMNVSKPDGTTFINLFDPSDTLTVSGGKLNVSVGSKGSKIYMAGSFNTAGYEINCALDNTYISYNPEGGPLDEATGNISIALQYDDQVAQDYVMQQVNDEWVFSFPRTNAANDITFWFYDESDPVIYDNNDGDNYNEITLDCWKTGIELAFVGNVTHWPETGQIEPGSDVWVNIESWPQGAGIEGLVRFSSDGGATWVDVPLNYHEPKGNNDGWHANLGPFGSGADVLYSVMLFGDDGEVWNDNEGDGYGFPVNSNVLQVNNVTGTYHWPLDGDIDSVDDLWINTESTPRGAGFGGKVAYSSDGGTTWTNAAFVFNGTNDTADLWHVNLGKFAPETVIQYAVMVEDEEATETWDNNGGIDFSATVNEAASSIEWFGSTRSFGARTPNLAVDKSGIANLLLGLNDLSDGVTYSLCVSSNLHDWSIVEQFTANADGTVDKAIPGGGEANSGTFFCLRIDHGTPDDIVDSENMVVSIETTPVGGATEASIVFSADGGTAWADMPMIHAGENGLNDVWTVNLGTYPSGTVIQYAVAVQDTEGNSLWDNNGSSDYVVTIVP